MQENQSIRTGFPKATKILVEKLPVKKDVALSFKTQPSYTLFGLSWMHEVSNK